MRKSLGALGAAVSGLPIESGPQQQALREMVYAWPAGVVFDDWPDVSRLLLV
jgi:hypothetical protein